MIRPLRRRHARVIPVLLLVLAVTMVVALSHRPPAPRLDALPALLAAAGHPTVRP